MTPKPLNFIPWVLLFLPFKLFTQTPGDSLKKELSYAESDSTRLRLLGLLTQYYIQSDIMQAAEYGHQALIMEPQFPDHPGIAHAHIAVGEILSAQGRYSDQVSHLYVARRIYQKSGDRNGLIGTYNHLAGLFYNLHIYPQALSYWRQALTLAEQDESPKQRAMLMNNIGSLYHETNQQDSAGWYYRTAFEMLSSSPEPTRLKSILLSNQAEIMILNHQYDRADSFVSAATEIASIIHSHNALSDCLGLIGKLKMMQGKPHEAVSMFHSSMAHAREVKALPREATALRGLSEAWMAGGNADSANHYYALYVEARDSLDQMGLFTSISSDLFEREQKIEEERTLMLKEFEIQKKREERIWFLAGLALLLITAVFLLLRFLSNRRMAKDLEREVRVRTQQLEAANAELNKFIYQSSHDLRSPLLSILGLADVALNSTGKEREYVHLMRERAAHLDHAYTSLINTLNIRGGEVKPTTADMGEIVTAEVEEVKRMRKNDNAIFNIEIPPNTRVTTDVYLLGLCLRNLLLNAVDFAKTGQSPVIKIQASVSEGRLSIRISDQGEGISPEARSGLFGMFFRGSIKSKGRGLGLYNVKLAVDKLGGEVFFHPSQGEGAMVELYIPVPEWGEENKMNLPDSDQ